MTATATLLLAGGAWAAGILLAWALVHVGTRTPTPEPGRGTLERRDDA